jgi:hypothetical protein
MNTKTLRALCLILPAFALFAPSLWAGGSPEDGYRVLATTSWTAAFVREAGVEDVGVLAPYDVQHPPEYELKPSDIARVSQAEMIVFAGYENMVSRIKEAAGSRGPTLVQITTVHSMTAVTESVRRIAEIQGTLEAAEQNLEAIGELFKAWREEIVEAGLDRRPVLVHFHQQALARELGMQVAGVFGPAPLEAPQIRGLTATQAVLIIDNAHNPIAQPLTETLPEAKMVELFNFPATSRRGTVRDILTDNRRRFRKVLE